MASICFSSSGESSTLWTLRETLRLRPGERIREYECIESNEDLQRFERLLEESRRTEAAR